MLKYGDNMMLKYKCQKCGREKESKCATGINCVCGARITKYLRTCPVCGDEKYISFNAKQCASCYGILKVRMHDTDGCDVPVELLRGKSERIQQLIKYNWWSANDFARAVAQCVTDAEAEQLYKDFLSGKGRAQYRANSYANNYGNV